jgi:diamine N-acetyltransferase
MNIRLANTEDLMIVEQLARTIWPVTYGELLPKDQLAYMLNLMYSQQSLQEQLLQQQHTFLIAGQDDQPIGFAAYSLMHPGVYKLHKLYVLPGLHGKGIGRQLLQFIIEEIVGKGGRHLQLNVKRDNPARFFYEKMGFIITGEVDINIGQGYFMRDYVMEKVIG